MLIEIFNGELVLKIHAIDRNLNAVIKFKIYIKYICKVYIQQ